MKKLAALLTAGPLDKKKDEQALFNKVAGPCQATISPQQLLEMRERDKAKNSRSRNDSVTRKMNEAKRVSEWRKTEPETGVEAGKLLNTEACGSAQYLFWVVSN